jgi:DNA-binding transcriptional LysR family regulator
MDQLRAMKTLVAVIKSGSFSEASRQLGAPVSTLSRIVGEFEQRLGASLLVRTTRNLKLTEAGEAYLIASRSILEQVEAADRAARGEFQETKGNLVVASPIAFGQQLLLPIVVEFLERFQSINVQLAMSDRNARLIEDHIDLALRVGDLPDSGLMATRLGVTRHVVCASTEFLAAHGRPRTPHDLTAYPCITHDLRGLAARWTFAEPSGGREFSVPIEARLSVGTAEAARAAAIRGFGLTRLKGYQAVSAVRDGTLQVVLSEYELPARPVSFLYAAGGAVPVKLRSFMDFAAPRLRAALADMPPELT